MIRYISATFISLLCLTGQPAVASWYQVEVIVFEHLRPDLGGEVWFENPGLPSRADSINLISTVPDVIGKGQTKAFD